MYLFLQLFWLVTEGYEDGSAKEMRKWIYEIFSTFLADGAVRYAILTTYTVIARGIDKVAKGLLMPMSRP